MDSRFIFILLSGKPGKLYISLPKLQGVRKTITEERDERIKSKAGKK